MNPCPPLNPDAHFYKDLAIAFCCALEMAIDQTEDPDDIPRIRAKYFREAAEFLGSDESFVYRLTWLANFENERLGGQKCL